MQEYSLSTQTMSTSTKLIRTVFFPVTQVVAKIFGLFFWNVLSKRRKHTIQTISKHLNIPMQDAEHLARESFKENFQSFFECPFIPFFGFNDPDLQITRPELLKIMQDVDRPIVATTGHFGSWELLAALIGDFSEKKPRAIVVRNYKNKLMQFCTTRLRSSKGAIIFGHRRTTFSVLRILKKLGVVAFLVDHNTNEDEAFFLPFLGEVAAVNKGPAILAVRAKAIVFPVFLERNDNKYIFHMEEPLDTCLLTGSVEEKAYVVAKYYTEAVEKIVKSSPSQWFWMHNRWKTQPKEKNKS